MLNLQETEESNTEVKQWVTETFKQLCIRIGKSGNQVMRTQFSKEATTVQQKGRRIPIHLRELVEKEFNKLLD